MMPPTRTIEPVAIPRGYVISEAAEHGLRDMFTAMESIAFVYDEEKFQAFNFDLQGDQIAAINRSFARLGRLLIRDSVFQTGSSPAQN